MDKKSNMSILINKTLYRLQIAGVEKEIKQHCFAQKIT